ncbi:MAG: YCF48-related protein [Pyrinomonadaceae bacterium]
MAHLKQAARCGSMLLLFLTGCFVASARQRQASDNRPREVTPRWERVYWELGGAALRSVFSAPVQSGGASSPRWLWVGDEKGFLRLAAFNPDSQSPLGPQPSPASPLQYFGLSKLEVMAPAAADARARGASVNAIYFDEQGDGYLLKGNRLYFSSNAGFGWSQLFEVPNLPDGTPATLFSIAITGRGACMVGMFSQPDDVKESLVYCTDRRPAEKGARWERVRVGPQKTQLFHVFFRGDKRGWIVGTQGTILRTTNYGKDWEQVEFESKSLRQSYFVSESDGWIVGLSGTLLRTSDAGAHWDLVTLPFGGQLANISLRSIKFSADGRFGWIVGDQGTILYSDDAGENWRILPPPAKDIRLEALFVDDYFCWAVGGGSNVWRQRLK